MSDYEPKLARFNLGEKSKEPITWTPLHQLIYENMVKQGIIKPEMVRLEIVFDLPKED